MFLPRVIEPEWLDQLPASDPRAQRSRRDLRRVNFLMNNVGILQRCLQAYEITNTPHVIVELGAGDGTLMLALAQRLAPTWPSVRVILVDRQPSMAENTRRAFHKIGWEAECVTADVFDWLARTQAADVIMCNLFLHHFQPQPLTTLLALCAQRTSLFVACEPARSRLALYGSHLLGVIGCNDVTRHDAVASVHAGFRRQELTALWPRHESDPGANKQPWLLDERSAGLFSHTFVARRVREPRCEL